MKNIFLPLLAIGIVNSSCGNASTQTESDNKEELLSQVDSTATKSENSPEENGSDNKVIDLFSDFPSIPMSAKPGEYLLIPAYKTLVDYANGKNNAIIYYHAKLAEAGDKISTVAFTFDGQQEVPNHMIIPIKSGEKVKKGDVVLTWWQSGSGMQRAIVTDASNPSMPEVHYLDIAWDNPAKKNEVPIGQLKEQIKENTFVKITDIWQPGTTVARLDGTSVKKYTIVNVAEDKVLVLGFAGSIAVLDKSACTPLKVNASVKVGDRIQAPWVGTFKAGVVKELKPEYGRAVIVFDHDKEKEHVIPFGDITTGLIL